MNKNVLNNMKLLRDCKQHLNFSFPYSRQIKQRDVLKACLEVLYSQVQRRKIIDIKLEDFHLKVEQNRLIKAFHAIKSNSKFEKLKRHSVYHCKKRLFNR